MAAMLCRHCKRRRVSRPRGLCHECFYTPGVRALYHPTSKFARRGLGVANATPPLPDGPCDAQPGSEARIETLERRARSRRHIWHPLDRGAL